VLDVLDVVMMMMLFGLSRFVVKFGVRVSEIVVG